MLKRRGAKVKVQLGVFQRHGREQRLALELVRDGVGVAQVFSVFASHGGGGAAGLNEADKASQAAAGKRPDTNGRGRAHLHAMTPLSKSA